MLYEVIKVFHVISAAVLFGTGIGSAAYKFLANRSKNTSLIADATHNVVYADWIFTGTAGVFQPVSGMAMVMIKGYSIGTFWILWSIIGYLVAAFCWFPVAAMQIKLARMAKIAAEQNTQLPPHYTMYYRLWMILGIPAFCSLITVIFLMTNRPETYTEFLRQLGFY